MSDLGSQANAGSWNVPLALECLLERNRCWVKRKTQADPEFFARLVGQQRPDYFWIGCSDSRVPATEIVDLDPGEMFVHRNVANLASDSDPNFQAALVFAVELLRVRHILVVGHYGCGGVSAALRPPELGAVTRWLSPVDAILRAQQASFARCANDESVRDRFCELNVIAQVDLLAGSSVLAKAWSQGRELAVHGCIYAIKDGLLKSVCRSVVGPSGQAQPEPVISDDDWLDCNMS